MKQHLRQLRELYRNFRKFFTARELTFHLIFIPESPNFRLNGSHFGNFDNFRLFGIAKEFSKQAICHCFESPGIFGWMESEHIECFLFHSLQKLYGDWTSQQWTRHAFLPPLETRFLRILPHDCVSPCCMNVRLYNLRGGRSESYYIAALFPSWQSVWWIYDNFFISFWPVLNCKNTFLNCYIFDKLPGN